MFWGIMRGKLATELEFVRGIFLGRGKFLREKLYIGHFAREKVSIGDGEIFHKMGFQKNFPWRGGSPVLFETSL